MTLDTGSLPWDAAPGFTFPWDGGSPFGAVRTFQYVGRTPESLPLFVSAEDGVTRWSPALESAAADELGVQRGDVLDVPVEDLQRTPTTVLRGVLGAIAHYCDLHEQTELADEPAENLRDYARLLRLEALEVRVRGVLALRRVRGGP